MGSKSSKQTTENRPPAWAAPLFSKSAGEATKLYDSGAGGGVYQGQTVADLGQTTQQGIQGVSNAAGNWNMPNYQNMLSKAGQPTSSAANLAGMASGENLLANPHFNDALQGQLDKTAAQVQSQFSGAGRYGSGANTGALTSELGNIRSNALYNQFNQDTANMMAANQMIDNSNAQSIASQLGIGNQAFQNQLAGSQAQIGAGQLQDQNQQQHLTADMAKWMSEDMQDWTRLGLLQSAAAGSAGNYGTNVQTQTQPFNVMSGAGALGSLLFKSDARLKVDMEPVGTIGRHVVWEFSYRGSTVRYRGVMAQFALDIEPDAVVTGDDGFYAVDYARLEIPMEMAA